METYKDLKKRYEDAVDAKLTTFFWDERAIVTQYAKYLLEHMENRLGLNKEK
jgi:hypothetical protein